LTYCGLKEKAIETSKIKKTSQTRMSKQENRLEKIWKSDRVKITLFSFILV
jgi:hypothetical protein